MKTSELTGVALDWAVAKCVWPDDIGNTVPFHRDGSDYEPSRKWAHGGPIIEREMIAISRGGSYAENFWRASRGFSDDRIYGPTPLIAAMRCYVASKLGDNIEIPEELK